MTQDDIRRAWQVATNSIEDPLLQAPESLAEQAFEHLLDTRHQSQWLAATDLSELAHDCALLASRLRHGGPGFVKCIYFTTRGTQVHRILAGLVFMSVFARLNRYDGPLAWISFPSNLLWSPINPASSRIATEIEATFRNIQHVADPALASPIDFAFGSAATEPSPAKPHVPSIYFDSSYPFRSEHGGHSEADIDVQYGLPLICVPSRVTETIAIRMTPSPLVGEHRADTALTG